jgi:hypothetical protein
MTELKQRLDHARRAELAWEEFFAPMIAELKAAYTERLAEVANTELNPRKRSDKVTALANALKIVGTLESGMLETIRDGELAKQEQLRAEKIEQMAPSARRLLNIAPF